MKYLFSFSVLILSIVSALAATRQIDPIPVHETFKIQSAQVGESRTINVWLPEGYLDRRDSLPVMYMADGGLKEDFPHIANTFSTLIKEKKIPAFILVGIENTQRRRDLTGPTEVATDKKIAPVVGGSGKFRSFINEELIPEINKRYRTTNTKGILGESLSGLFVMETFFLTPEMFDYYIAFDPSLWWNDHYLVKTAKEHLAKFPVAKKNVWFAGSGTEDIFTFTRELSAILTKENHPGIRWTYSDEPGEQHSTIFRATKEKALIWAFSEMQ